MDKVINKAACAEGREMFAEEPIIDCRGLTPALSVLRIKQTILSDPKSKGRFNIFFEQYDAHSAVMRALGSIADRVRFVSETAGEVGQACDVTAATNLLPRHSDTLPVETWWQREDLNYRDGKLHLGTANLENLAAQVGTPAYVLSSSRIAANIQRLATALAATGCDSSIYYAIKANRNPSLLTYLRVNNLCGADVCSAEELLHAIACGFPCEAISFTGTSLSADELKKIAAFGEIKVNIDSLSALNAFGKLCPGRTVGLRINPARGIGYHGYDLLKYSGDLTTKFGIYLEHLDEAVSIADKWKLRIERIHFHAGSGYLNPELASFRGVLRVVDDFLNKLPEVVEVNVGGGMGVPHSSGDRPLDLDLWAQMLANTFGARRLRILVEPGDFLVKDAGVLLATVNYVEQRRDVLFAGLDAGFNLAPEPAFYGLPCEPVAIAPRRDVGTEIYTIVGNINEALDRWIDGHEMPILREGDFIALLNAGGYSSSMRSDHCLRGRAREVILIS